MQTEEGWEEFFDYIFPEDESAKPNLKLLANAKLWKKKLQDMSNDSEGSPQEDETEDKVREGDSDTSVTSSSEDESEDEQEKEKEKEIEKETEIEKEQE